MAVMRTTGEVEATFNATMVRDREKAHRRRTVASKGVFASPLESAIGPPPRHFNKASHLS